MCINSYDKPLLIQPDQKWLYEVKVPRALVGEYLAALKDSEEVVKRMTFLLKSGEIVSADSIGQT